MTIAFIVAPISYVTRIPSTSLATQVKVRELVLPEMERHGPIEAWIIDDTGFPKKGQGAARCQGGWRPRSKRGRKKRAS
jgi:hypothetical protein